MTSCSPCRKNLTSPYSLCRAFGDLRARAFLFIVCLLLVWPVNMCAAAPNLTAPNLTAPSLAATPILAGMALDDMALDERCLRESYPHAVAGLEREGEVVWLRFLDGRRVLYADTTPPVRDADGALREATVRQSMAEPYPLGAPDTLTPTGNAGRDRSAALIEALYGDSPDALRLQSVRVGQSTIFLSAQAAQAFEAVASKLEQLAAHPQLAQVIYPLGGGQYWRTIAGTQRLSAHSYGIAVDLNPKAGPYWRWTPHRTTLYPQKIVEVFERNGFIWGGRWERFDLMHFEYRPEIICKSAYR